MTWNWEKSDWPNYTFDSIGQSILEEKFLYTAGSLRGALKYVKTDEREELIVQLITQEAYKTSEIEGEILDRQSLQSSIRRHFGLHSDLRKSAAAEQGISNMMMDLYRHFHVPLSATRLFKWHSMLMSGRRDLKRIGAYRKNTEPMQVVSGPLHKVNIHFEAPPAKTVPPEMARFMRWFNGTAPHNKGGTRAESLPALTRASIAHLYFVTIHPFEDGNGRIARALAEKALSQAIGQPTLIALSREIQAHRKQYYAALRQTNQTNEISDWLRYFSQTILDAQQHTLKQIEFLMEKTKVFDRLRGQINDRQEKVIARIFREGLEGFKGGLSAENYISITRTSRATATRDLHELVELGIFRREGVRKHTRYYLKIPQN